MILLRNRVFFHTTPKEECDMTRKPLCIRFLCFLLTLLLLCPMILPGLPARAASYSVEKALAYAKAHWNDGQGLCAEFVSRCVIAGGLNIGVHAGTGNCRRAISSASGLDPVNLVIRSDGYAYKADNGSILAPGDVVVQWCYTHDIGPHILLCGGYDSKGRATFYAHNAAMNNQAYRLGVNTAYEHTLDCDMGGRVIRLSTLSSGSSAQDPAPETPVEVKFLSTTDPNYTSKYFVTETNACPVILCKKTAGSHVSTAGIRIYQENDLVDEFEMNVTNVSDSLDRFHIWFDLNKECGITLQPGTTYRYVFFVTVNGKEYAGAPLYFTTLGTSIKPVSVLLNGNGGSVSPGFISVTLGKTYPALPTPVRDGYIFTGWYTGTSSSAQRVSAGDAVPATPPSFLYAHWEKIPVVDYTVTLHVYVDGKETDVREYENESPNFRMNLEGAISGCILDGAESNFAFTREGDTLIFQGITGPCTIAAYFVSQEEEEELPSGLLQNFVYDNWAWEGYNDVVSDQWFYANVRSATRLGLMQGAEKGRFYPGNQLTVAEMLALACRVHLRYHTGESDLPSTGSGPWYEKYVDYAMENGLIDRNYQMNAPADRDLFALVFSRVLPQSALEERNPDISFADISSCQNPQAVRLLGKAGIIVGSITEKGRVYQPASPILRSEAAAILTRIADRDLRQII